MPYTTGNKVPGNTLEEKEVSILRYETPLRLDNFLLSENDDCIEDFVYNFLVSYNQKHKTVVVDLNPASPREFTGLAKHRSIIDIFLITKYYFPQTTLKDVIKALWTHEENLCRQICSTIHRRVYECKGLARYTTTWINANDFGHDELGYTADELKNIAKN